MNTGGLRVQYSPAESFGHPGWWSRKPAGTCLAEGLGSHETVGMQKKKRHGVSSRSKVILPPGDQKKGTEWGE